MSKKPRLFDDVEIRVLVDRLEHGDMFVVATPDQRQKVLNAARFQGKRITTRRNKANNTFTVIAL